MLDIYIIICYNIIERRNRMGNIDLKKLLGERIRIEREKMNISLLELSRKIGFKNYQVLSNIEHGRRNVTTNELIKIAKSLSLSLDYLLFEQSASQECRVIWRECKSPEKCKVYENRLKTFCFNYKKLNEIMSRKINPFFPLSKEDRILRSCKNYFKTAEKLADRIIDEYELGSYPALNLIEALKLRDILIFFFDLRNHGSSASMLGDFGGAIVLNTKNKLWRRNFDIAHEFFHLLTWDIFDLDKLNNNNKSDIEKYADAFASNLLIPGKVLDEEIKKINQNLNPMDIINLSLKFCVSLDAMLWKLLNFKYISVKEKDKLINNSYLKKVYEIQFSSKFITEVDELPDNYIWLILNAYMEEKISKMKMANYLNKNIGEIDYFLKQRGLPLSV